MKRDLDQMRRDAEIARDALTALKRGADVRHDGITVTVENGWLSLRGHAEGVVERSMAECVTHCVSGVTGVTNLLGIVRSASVGALVPGVGTRARTGRGGSRAWPHPVPRVRVQPAAMAERSGITPLRTRYEPR